MSWRGWIWRHAFQLAHDLHHQVHEPSLVVIIADKYLSKIPVHKREQISIKANDLLNTKSKVNYFAIPVKFSLPNIKHIIEDGHFVGLCFAIAASDIILRRMMANIINCDYALKKPHAFVKNTGIYTVKWFVFCGLYTYFIFSLADPCLI